VVASGVVKKDGFVEERAGAVEQHVEGVAGPAQLMEAECFMDVSAGFERGGLSQTAGNVEGVLPAFFAHETEGENFQHIGPAEGFGGELVEFLPHVFVHAELKIAVGGQNDSLVVVDHERMGIVLESARCFGVGKHGVWGGCKLSIEAGLAKFSLGSIGLAVC
jgi:hypothetical protein